MKIKRFVDKDMRHVLRSVRKDQGPDAVILSNRRVAEGVEVIAAVDYDEALVQHALAAGPQPSSAVPATDSIVSEDAPPETSNPSRKIVDLVSADLRPAPLASLNDAAAASSTEPSSIAELHSEVTSLRGMMETHFAGLAWQDTVSSSPMRAQMLRNLTRIGVGPDVANMVIDRIPPLGDAKQLWRAPMQELAKTIPIRKDSLLETGGVAALIGPTGVGKTTTIAKMAAQFTMRFGADNVALISTDAHRIGAEEQLRTFANILGVQVYAADNAQAVSHHLQLLRDRKLVLIDTEGTGQRDMKLSERLAAYGQNSDRVRYYLTLSAASQESVLDEIIRVFNRVPLSGSIITKTDETAQLGCALSALIRHDLPLAYVTDGQRIPDDLHAAAKKRLWMINQALDCMRSSDVKVSEELMVSRFGAAGVEYHAH